jgi:hypothetical protein
MTSPNKLYNVKTKIPASNGSVSYSDIILPLTQIGQTSPGVSFTGSPVLKSFNLVGSKLCYTIPYTLSFNTIVDGILKATVNIPQGVYTVQQLENIICDVSTGISVNVNSNTFLIAANTSKLLSIRFLTSIDSMITNLLGLSNASSNVSGIYTTYDLPITGMFPSEYNFGSTTNAIISFGFSSNINQNPLDIQSIPLSIITPDVFELDANSDYNLTPQSLSYNGWIGNLSDVVNYYVRIRIETLEQEVPIYNINDLNLFLTFEDVRNDFV